VWIIPKQLSAFAPDTADWSSGLNSLVSMCDQSLMWRSKPSQSATWLQRWKRIKWFRRLCGRILKPSLHDSFAAAYTASLPVIRASHSLPQESGEGLPILDTFGRLYENTSVQLDLFGASLKTSKDTSTLDSKRFSETFEKWVTQLRQDCLRRQKSARLTSESDYSSWLTPRANDPCENPESFVDRMGDRGEHCRGSLSSQVNWQSPRASDHKGFMNKGKGCENLMHQVQSWGTPSAADSVGSHGGGQGKSSRTDIFNLNWKTPKTPTGGAESRASRASRGSGGEDLAAQVTSWPTSRQAEYKGCGPKGSKSQIHRLKRDYLDATVEELDGRPAQDKSSTTGSPRAQLNPDWVETLMGIPVGWTAFDFAETE
jgi:hypothetical protein